MLPCKAAPDRAPPRSLPDRIASTLESSSTAGRASELPRNPTRPSEASFNRFPVAALLVALGGRFGFGLAQAFQIGRVYQLRHNLQQVADGIAFAFCGGAYIVDTED